MRRFGLMVSTARRLGAPSIARVLAYRVGLRTRLHPVCWIHAVLPQGPFFSTPASHVASVAAPFTPKLFGWIDLPLGDVPPDWYRNVLTGLRVSSGDTPWWDIPDFDPAVRDIKGVWEASRFDWSLAFAQHALCGDARAIEQLNVWIADWCKSNPAYLGPNWKCGQETSLRVLHLAVTAILLDQVDTPSVALMDLIEAHVQRVAPTVSYAVGQDNNHGTSEASALFVGGTWLARNGRTRGTRWAAMGRRMLENRVAHLVAPDGSFAQHSVNYHRMMLDTLCIAELWRHRQQESAFSGAFYERAAAAAAWLRALVHPATGDAPNVGANDGARLIPLTDTDYRDYRPAAHLACVLFMKERAWDHEGPWDDALRWLRVDAVTPDTQSPQTRLFDSGGYATLRAGRATALLRYPRFRFRPAHADALHLDLMIDGLCHLPDAGSYSYNAEPEWLLYFPGTACHNTVQFDDRDQMPRLGRFLYGDWLQTDSIDLGHDEHGVRCSAAYHDAQGAEHRREVVMTDAQLTVRDHVSGFTRKAVLRWRLKQGSWQLAGNRATNGTCSLDVTGAPFTRLQIVTGWESRYYGVRTEMQVLEVEVEVPCIIQSSYTWAP